MVARKKRRPGVFFFATAMLGSSNPGVLKKMIYSTGFEKQLKPSTTP
jgi:hypothetical protein